MSIRSLLTKSAIVAGGLGLLGTLGATAASAATLPPAAPAASTVTAVTHLNNHPDTTSVSGSATLNNDSSLYGPIGPVWALDNATEKFTIVSEGDGAYTVTMSYVGSFHGFANPRTAAEMAEAGLTSPDPGAALDSAGSVKGSITYTVTSKNAPDPAALPGQSPSDAHIGDNIQLLFDGGAVISGNSPYTFTYHQIEGADYTQVG